MIHRSYVIVLAIGNPLLLLRRIRVRGREGELLCMLTAVEHPRLQEVAAAKYEPQDDRPNEKVQGTRADGRNKTRQHVYAGPLHMQKCGKTCVTCATRGDM